jgi:hypothetical protein
VQGAVPNCLATPIHHLLGIRTAQTTYWRQFHHVSHNGVRAPLRRYNHSSKLRIFRHHGNPSRHRLDASFPRPLEHRLARRTSTSCSHFPHPQCTRPTVPVQTPRSVARKSGQLCNAPGPPTMDAAKQRTTWRHAGRKRNSSPNHCGKRIRTRIRQPRLLRTVPPSHLLRRYCPTQSAAAPPHPQELVVDVHRPRQNQL